MLKAMGWGVYPEKSGLHENILHSQSTKDCHLMQKNSSAMDVAVHTKGWEKCSCTLGHPHIMHHALLHPLPNS